MSLLANLLAINVFAAAESGTLKRFVANDKPSPLVFRAQIWPRVQMIGANVYFQAEILNSGNKALKELSLGCLLSRQVNEYGEGYSGDTPAAPISPELLAAITTEGDIGDKSVSMMVAGSGERWRLASLPVGGQIRVMARYSVAEIGVFSVNTCLREAGVDKPVMTTGGSFIVTAGSYHRDTDADGVPDEQDRDDDNDGILDRWEQGEGGRMRDSDGDSIPDSRDLDAEADGVPDLWEAFGNKWARFLDVDRDAQIDGGVDASGVAHLLIESGRLQAEQPYLNTDGDQWLDFLDTDDDDDGLLTRQEGDYQQNSDATGLPDFRDDDDDDDGIATIHELVDTDGDGKGDEIVDSDGDGQYDHLQNRFEDSDYDGVPDEIDIDDDNDGILDFIEWANALNGGDTDLDGVRDELDVDADGDGVRDWDEAGHLAGDALADVMMLGEGFGENGYLDVLETGPDSGVPIFSPRDSDSDGLADFQDTGK